MATLVVSFPCTHNELKTYPVVFANSTGKMLNEANSRPRDSQWECHFSHNNSEQYYHNLPGRQTQSFLLVGLQSVRSRIPEHIYSV